MSAPWVRATRHWSTVYRRTWRGTVFSSFLSPLLFLSAMGVGLGSLVDRNSATSARLGGVGYLTFLAPGLLAMSTLLIASQEALWPVNGAVRWDKAYVAMVNTPLGPRDCMIGHFAYITYRLLTVAAMFVAVMVVFGAVHSPWIVLGIPAAALCGMAMAVPMAGYAVGVIAQDGFPALLRFVVTPMTLFAGAFFPVSQLPAWLRPLAYITPMWHGVSLCRGLALGTAGGWSSLGHVGVLAAFVIVGAAYADRRYARVLVP